MKLTLQTKNWSMSSSDHFCYARLLGVALTCTLKTSWTQFSSWCTIRSLCMYLSLFSLKNPLEVTLEDCRSASNVALYFIATRRITVHFSLSMVAWSHSYAQYCSDQAFQTTLNISCFSYLAKHRAVSKWKYFLLCFPKQSNRFRSWYKFWSAGSTLNDNQASLHCRCLSLQLRQEASQQGQDYSR